jgi:hypothetical protein
MNEFSETRLQPSQADAFAGEFVWLRGGVTSLRVAHDPGAKLASGWRRFPRYFSGGSSPLDKSRPDN